jgi:hypothetical protein
MIDPYNNGYNSHITMWIEARVYISPSAKISFIREFVIYDIRKHSGS